MKSKAKADPVMVGIKMHHTFTNIISQRLHGIIASTIKHDNLGIFGLKIEMKTHK
jgi:hypothetical protein